MISFEVEPAPCKICKAKPRFIEGLGWVLDHVPQPDSFGVWR